jgi:hypothetical protein
MAQGSLSDPGGFPRGPENVPRLLGADSCYWKRVRGRQEGKVEFGMN